MTRITEKYKKEVLPKLKNKFGYKNDLSVPRLDSIVVGVGIGRVDDQKIREMIGKSLEKITGQRPALRRSRKAIASFKLRKGQLVGYQVTLRGARMEQFLDKFINITLPRVRDFRGVNPKSFDGHGNYSIGLKEQNVFPEIPFDQIEQTHGVQITIKTTAAADKEARSLLEALGMPFAKDSTILSSEDVTEEEERASLLAHAKAKAARTATAANNEEK